MSLSLSSILNKATNKWTLTNSSGSTLVEFTSFLSMDLRNEGQVVNSGVEQGSFASYNKVTSPLELDVQLGFSGTDSELQTVLDTLTKLQEGTDLVNVVTPNAEYEDLSLEAFSYSRKRENGLGVLFVDLSFVEIKEVSTSYTSTTLSTKTNRGKVQTSTVSSTTSSSSATTTEKSVASMLLG